MNLLRRVDGRRRSLSAAVACMVIVLAGCATHQQHGTGTRRVTSTAPAERDDGYDLAGSVKHGWRKLTRTVRGNKVPESWHWTTGIATDVPRAEVIPPALPAEALARLAPEQSSHVRLVSGAAEPDPFLIQRIGDEPVDSLATLTLAAEAAAGSEPATLHVCNASALGEADLMPIVVPPDQLAAVAQLTSPEHRIVRIARANGPAAVIRHEAVRCTVTPRVERERGLLQVTLETRVCWGPEQLLPKEVTATCDGTPLRCLTLAETLELLYGDFDSSFRSEDTAKTSFAVVSEREDYLIPSNYQRLLEDVEADRDGSFAKRARPALVDLPGIEYPGPAVLGDARALEAFLQQREFVRPEELPRIAWVMFAGEALRKGGQVKVAIDLGQGPVPVHFMLPL